MPFKRTRPKLELNSETIEALSQISRSRTEAVRRVQRAQFLLGYNSGKSVSELARTFKTNRPRIERCVDKALQLGAIASLDDIKRTGRPRVIADDAKAWLINLACRRPTDLGYPHELWTTDLLARHARSHCDPAGHPSLVNIGRGTVSKILKKQATRPHKTRYFLEHRDPDFEMKMIQVLYVYRDVATILAGKDDTKTAIISYDEKPGIQALGCIRDDSRPKPGIQRRIGRDSEYIRHGTVSLMAGIDLLNGWTHGRIVERHRSKEFIEFLQMLDQYYDAEKTIRIILDNHSIHTSKETRAYLKAVPNRFEFAFTPKHGSWLNLVESFFSKMTRTMLRGIRVNSKEELRERIMTYLSDINQEPIVFRWKYNLDETKIL